MPAQNKIGQMLMSPLLRNVVGQVRRKIDFRFMMDRGRIFIANLAKAELGADKTGLLGSLLVAGMQHAAFSRSDLPEHERLPFALYIDEFQSFATDSFETILSESRKYGLSLVLAHQFASQLSPNVADAVFGNVGSLVAFRLGHTDAVRIGEELGGGLATELVDLPNHRVYARILTGGRVTEPFHAKMFPAQGAGNGRSENVVSRSRQKYGVPKEIVKGKISRWFRSSTR